MNSEFELIRYNDNLPARIEIIQGKIETPYHWHKEIELVFVLDGELEIDVNSKLITLCTNDFRLINSVENHSVTAKNAKCLILDISYEFAEKFDPSLYNTFFEIVGGSGAEDEIRNLLWQLSRSVSEAELPALRQYPLITDMLHVLFVQCKCRRENPNLSQETDKVQSRHVKLAMEYIEHHYMEDITLIGVAEKLGVQPEYLGARFKESTGFTPMEFVLKYRLDIAMDALLNQGMSIEDAAIAGGFPSKRTFVAKCKQAYNITPFQIIKQKRSGSVPLERLR